MEGQTLVKIVFILFSFLGALVGELTYRTRDSQGWNGALGLKAGVAVLIYLVLGVSLYSLAGRLTAQDVSNTKSGLDRHRREKLGAADETATEPQVPSVASTLKLIKERRSVMHKDMTGERVSDEDIATLLEAANWAPTHHRSEPWRYVVIPGPGPISQYLDFIDSWYSHHRENVPDTDYADFLKKYAGMRASLPTNASHLLVIGMKRQALPDKRLPEWEELCAVAASVQNIYLAVTSLPNCGGFWSSHTWCKHARDSPEFKEYLGLVEEDKVLGAFVLGKVEAGRKFRSSRGSVEDKVTWRTEVKPEAEE